jgi:soluble lytic murein transglycosylase-like protein
MASGIAVAQPSSPEPSRQSVPAPAAASRDLRKEAAAGMEISLSAQRDSVALQQSAIRKQTSGAPEGTHNFFTAPWTAPRLPLLAAAAQTHPECEPVSRDLADSLIAENATRQNMNPDLLRAVIRKESAFYPCAVSSKGALGLMQLMPSTAEMLGVTDPFDPKQNVDAGAKFLKQLIDKYAGDLRLALSAYNAGPGRVESAGGVPDISETKNYVEDILSSIRIE